MKDQVEKPDFEKIKQAAIKKAQERRYEDSNPFTWAFSLLVGGGGQYEKGIRNGIAENENKGADNSQNSRFLNHSIQAAALFGLLASVFFAANLITVVALVLGSMAITGVIGSAVFGFRSHMLQKGKNLVQEEYEQLFQEEQIRLQTKKEILESKAAGKDTAETKHELSSEIAAMVERGNQKESFISRR